MNKPQFFNLFWATVSTAGENLTRRLETFPIWTRIHSELICRYLAGLLITPPLLETESTYRKVLPEHVGLGLGPRYVVTEILESIIQLFGLGSWFFPSLAVSLTKLKTSGCLAVSCENGPDYGTSFRITRRIQWAIYPKHSDTDSQANSSLTRAQNFTFFYWEL